MFVKYITTPVFTGFNAWNVIFFCPQNATILPHRNDELTFEFMTHKFVVNTENVNEYGYRVLTDGIDYTQYLRNPVVLFMHTRPDGKRAEAIIGRTVSLTVEDSKLIAEIEFDEADDFAKEIAGKVQRGFLRMASMYADVIAASDEPELLLPGQTLETVTKCKLVEISIVDIGGNDDAIKLSKGNSTKLKQVNLNKKPMAKLAVIALALGLANIETATEDLVAAEVKKVVLAKEKAESYAAELQSELDAMHTAEFTSLVDRTIELGLIPEAMKSITLAACKNDPKGQRVVLKKLIADKETETGQSATHTAVKEVVLGGKGAQGKGNDEHSFDYLQKNDPVELKRIHSEEPEKYAKLAKEYAAGKRWNNKN